MNKNILGFCIGIVFCTSLSLNAQHASTPTVKSEGRHGRIEQEREYKGDIIRFFNKEGVKTKEFRSETTEAKASIAKGKPFDSSRFEIPLSSATAALVERVRKHNPKRDILVIKTKTQDVEASANKKFAIIAESYSVSMDFADASDSEQSDTPVEAYGESTVYDSDGKVVVKITDADGYEPRVSSTGQYFVLTSPNQRGRIILNSKKEVLAELPYSNPTFAMVNVYFSDTDKFIILAELTNEYAWAISVFDTQNLKLELRKLTIPNDILKRIENLDISEEKREMTIVHTYHVLGKIKVDRIVF